MNLEINTDSFAVKAQIEADIQRVLPVLSMQILWDCNYFCKQDQGTLISSSIIHSDPEHGELVWHTLYAVMQYYLGTTSTDKNPNATKMWCQAAYARFGADWEALLQKLLSMDEQGVQSAKSALQGALDELSRNVTGGGG